MSAKAISVRINPAVLKWARESAGLGVQQTAKRLNSSTETVEGWETGSKQPTIRALETLATMFKRPLAAFFLPEPPREQPIPTDFRVLPGKERPALSKKTRLAIRRAQRLQALAKEMLEEMHIAERPVTARTTLRADPEKVARTERERLGIGLEVQFGWERPSEAFRAWREAVEALNVLVFQFSMPLTEARGFSLTDTELPAIVVNGSDIMPARTFTLFHEYAHLMLETGGLCLLNESLGIDSIPVEKFCNHFAGALLVPAEALLGDDRLRRGLPPGGLDEADLIAIANRFKVSRQVIWRRMLVTRLISSGIYRARLSSWEREATKAPQRARFWLPPARRCVQERGRMFGSLVLEAKDRDLITYKDVADFLSIRLGDLKKVDRIVRGSRNE